MSGQSIILRTQANKDLLLRVASAAKIDPAHPLEFVIRQHRQKRSLDQNALYWSWLGIIGRHMGEDPDYVHEFFKMRYVASKVATIMGQEIEVRSTTKLNTAEMSAYLDSIFNFAAHEGIILPHPEDRGYSDAA